LDVSVEESCKFYLNTIQVSFVFKNVPSGLLWMFFGHQKEHDTIFILTRHKIGRVQKTLDFGFFKYQFERSNYTFGEFPRLLKNLFGMVQIWH